MRIPYFSLKIIPMLKKYILIGVIFSFCGIFAFAQENPFVKVIKINPVTSLKKQPNTTGTYLNSYTTSLVRFRNE